MASEYKLKPYTPGHEPAHIRRLQIYATGQGSNPVTDLRFHIQAFSQEDDSNEGGVAFGSDAERDQLIEEFVKSPGTITPAITPSPLDFPIYNKCIVVIKLIGEFWRFSATRDPITTKADIDRYHGLSRIDTNTFLFYAKQPENPGGGGTFVRDGINFYVDFIQPGFSLPVIIDPDIENRGGGG